MICNINNSSKKIVYLCLGDCADMCAQLERVGCIEIQLPDLTKSERNQILIDYVNSIGILSKYNGKNRLWWATHISSKNRILSPMTAALTQIVSVLRTLDKCEKNSYDLVIIDASWPIIIFIKDFLEKKSISVKVCCKIWSRLYSMLSEWTKLLVSLIRVSASSFINIIKAHFSYGKISILCKSKPIYLIKSFVFINSFGDNDLYEDPFFGDIDTYLHNNINEDIQIVTISQGFEERYKCYRKMSDLNGKKLIPIESFLRLRDVFIGVTNILSYWITTSIKVQKNIVFYNTDISVFLSEFVKSTGKDILFGDYLYWYAARRLVKNYKINTCLLTYEGNHWEKLFTMGLKSLPHNIEIIGYHHSVIPQAAAGVFVSKWENDLIPQPDRIVTTGSITADLLKAKSCFPEDKIYTGCALRYKYLYNDYKQDTIKISNQIDTVLVALEGIMRASKLFFYTIDQAAKFPEIMFLIRAHPVLPIDVMLKNLGKECESFPNNIVISNHKQVSEDIKRCDAILYWGTAVAVEALLIGKPLINFNQGDALSFDPLFDYNESKWTINNDTIIMDVINEINRIDKKNLVKKLNFGRSYAKKYFAKEDSKLLKYFLPKNVSDGIKS